MATKKKAAKKRTPKAKVLDDLTRRRIVSYLRCAMYTPKQRLQICDAVYPWKDHETAEKMGAHKGGWEELEEFKRNKELEKEKEDAAGVSRLRPN